MIEASLRCCWQLERVSPLDLAKAYLTKVSPIACLGAILYLAAGRDK
jgi:hypothetical protein